MFQQGMTVKSPDHGLKVGDQIRIRIAKGQVQRAFVTSVNGDEFTYMVPPGNRNNRRLVLKQLQKEMKS